MLIRITEDQIEKIEGNSYPYFVYCPIHEKRLRARTKREVVSVAFLEGWRYDYNNARILCDECMKEQKK